MSILKIYLILSTSCILFKELLNSSIFSLKAKLEIEYIIINNNTKGKDVITDALLLISNIYKTINKADLIKTVFLNTLIIESECFNKLKKLI